MTARTIRLVTVGDIHCNIPGHVAAAVCAGGRAGRWPIVKHSLQEAIDEAPKLEAALARLRTRQRVAVLHDAPIQRFSRSWAAADWPIR